MNKEEVRAAAQARRKAMTPDAIRVASRAIWQQALALPAFAPARTVAGYLALPHEVQTDGILQAAHETGMQLRVPVAGDDGYRFVRYTPDDVLTEGRFEVREPETQADAEGVVDIALVPGLAFDPQGHRVGHGVGIYDRLLKAIAHPGLLRVGLAFDHQVVEALPVEAHDVAMDLVLTETRVLQRDGIGADPC